MNNKVILITGATGQQGGAAAKYLLKDGWSVRALVRDPTKEKAQELAKQGVELVQGDLYDRASLGDALGGVYGAFSVQNFWLPDVGYEGEIKQGKLFADAAIAAGVNHFVYSSVGAAHRGMGQKHFDSKWIVERYINEIGLPHTILRPVAFMDNLNWARAEISNGILTSYGVAPEKGIQLIAVDDIGAITAIVFSNREEYLGRTLEIAGDELSDREKSSILTEVVGRPVKLIQPQMPDDFAPDEEQMAGNRFFNGEGYTADIAEVRNMHPGLLNFERFLRGSGWEDLPVLPMPEGGTSWGRN